jgi:hypothetical protein
MYSDIREICQVLKLNVAVHHRECSYLWQVVQRKLFRSFIAAQVTIINSGTKGIFFICVAVKLVNWPVEIETYLCPDTNAGL